MQRALDEIRDNLQRLAERNRYTLEYLLSKPVLAQPGNTNGGVTQSLRDPLQMHAQDTNMVDVDDDEAADDGGEWAGFGD